MTMRERELPDGNERNMGVPDGNEREIQDGNWFDTR